MYYAHNALDDLETLWNDRAYFGELVVAYERLRSYLEHQKAKERIPELLKTR